MDTLTYISLEKLKPILNKANSVAEYLSFIEEFSYFLFFRIKLISSFTAMDLNGNQVENFGCSTGSLPLEMLGPMVEKYLKNPEDIQTMTMAMTMNHAGKLLVCNWDFKLWSFEK